MPSEYLCDDQSLVLSRPAPARRMIRFHTFYKGNCAKSTAYGWVKAGMLRIYKVGGATYTDMTFDEFVRQQAAEHDGGK
jgi:hypothetical protein